MTNWTKTILAGLVAGFTYGAVSGIITRNGSAAIGSFLAAGLIAGSTAAVVT